MSVEGEGGAAPIDLATARGRDYPSIRQFSIFLKNQVGSLLHLVRVIEGGKLRVCALSVSESSECAIVRIVVSEPERAFEILRRHDFEFCEVDLLVVELPDINQPVLEICSNLLQFEINIHYCFPLIRKDERQALAFYVDDHESVAKMLNEQGFRVLTEGDLLGD